MTRTRQPDSKATIPPWLALTAIMGLPAAVFYAFTPSLAELVRAWKTSEDYSHGFLVLPLFLYMIWEKREKLATLPVGWSPLGLVLFAGSLVFHVIAYYAGIQTLAYLSLVASLVFLALYLWGAVLVKEIAFPFFFLLFMIPVPEQIYTSLTVPLQLLVSKASVAIGLLAGLPLFREGNVIHMPDHTLAVVEACSGMRSLVSLFAVAAVLSYYTLNTFTARTMLILSAVPAALAANIIRLTAIIFFLYYLDLDLSKGTIHTVLGVIVFLFAVILLFFVMGVIAKWDRPLARD